MQQIRLNKAMLNTDMFTDVLFILSSSPGAMFEPNTVRFITKSEVEYYFNYAEDDIEYADIVKNFPLFGKCLKKDNPAPEGWNHFYLGLGCSMLIEGSVLPTFEKIASEQPNNIHVFANWRRIVRMTLDSCK